MEIKYLQDYGDKYKEQFSDIVHYCFRQWKKCDAMKTFEKADSKIKIIGTFEEDRLQSSLIVHEYDMFINNKTTKLGGIGAVATFGTDRKKGACANTMVHSLKYMYDNNFIFSALAPFSFEFYRKYGYEAGYNQMQIELNFDLLSNFACKGELELLWEKEQLKRIIPIYNKQARKLNGAVLRSEQIWDDCFNLNDGDKTYAIYKNEENIDSAYICFSFDTQNEQLVVSELFYEDINDLKALLNLIYVHSGQSKKIIIKSKIDNNILDILPSKYINISIKSGMMIRIINAEEALKLYNYSENGFFYYRY